MIIKLVLCSALMLSMGDFTPDPENSKYQILNEFIQMHNSGSQGAIINFIENRFSAADFKKMEVDKHVNFYNHIIKEFGPLNKTIYRVEEETETKLIVHLIKADESVKNKDIDPVDILEVEIDVKKSNSSYLSRGLGLGALACAVKKE